MNKFNLIRGWLHLSISIELSRDSAMLTELFAGAQFWDVEGRGETFRKGFLGKTSTCNTASNNYSRKELKLVHRYYRIYSLNIFKLAE